ncbi:efflux RND transporter periplasmic adaptor subunit [Chitinophagaceae bacterium 26-R-25]|nr:efflux RND transporter periplasmic adaptor subunit [Chitinophagaceae bacterium 26-R-25]
MKKVLFIIQVVFFAAVFTSCGNTGNEQAKQTEVGAHSEPGKENTATLTEAQIKAIGIETGTIEDKQLTSSLKANGVLQVPNQNKASISSVYNGVVKSLLVQPGNTVSKGQIIATIANPEFIQSQEEYLSLAPKIVLAEQEFSRQKELNEGNAGALKNLQAADAQLKALKTRRAALANQIQLMGINPETLTSDKLNSVLAVRSPIAGVVSDVVVKIGSFVSNGTSIADIVDNSQLHVDLFVYEKDLSKLRENQVIHFTLTNNPGKEYDAEIYSLGSSFEGESKAVTVHAKVKGNKTGLIDGMNITAVISLDKNTSPAVPSDAIVTQQGQDYIFVVTSETEKPEKMVTFEKIPVAKGTNDVGYTAITLLRQITPETKVVTKGAFFVLAKMTNSGEHEQ